MSVTETGPNFYTARLSQNRAILAPMAGFTDAPFRKLCRDYGSAWAVTEMVSAKALVQGDLQGIEIGKPYPGEPDLVIQVFGGEPEIVAAGGRILYDTYQPAALDINMGCPVKKVTGKSCGSKLMLDPGRAAEIVRHLAAAVPVPVSAKMRLGYDKVNAKEVALALQEAGASLVTVHGRTAAQKYSGEADWERIKEVAEALHIPVVGSGDVQDRAQAERYQAQGLGVMIGRGALGRPWIFAELRGAASPSFEERARTAYKHAEMFVAWHGAQRGVVPFRGQLIRYFASFPRADALRAEVVTLETLGDLAAFIAKHVGTEVSRDDQPSVKQLAAV